MLLLEEIKALLDRITVQTHRFDQLLQVLGVN